MTDISKVLAKPATAAIYRHEEQHRAERGFGAKRRAVR